MFYLRWYDERTLSELLLILFLLQRFPDILIFSEEFLINYTGQYSKPEVFRSEF